MVTVTRYCLRSATTPFTARCPAVWPSQPAESPTTWAKACRHDGHAHGSTDRDSAPMYPVGETGCAGCLSAATVHEGQEQE
jgi:hypothetical protein